MVSAAEVWEDRVVQRGPVTPVERVMAEIRVRLEDIEAGDALPSVRMLAEEYRTSTTTVSKALGRLQDEGLVTSVKGWGVFKSSLDGDGAAK